MIRNAFFSQESYQNSIFSEAYGKNMPPASKPDAPMMHQEPSLYSLFEGTPWSPSLPASSGIVIFFFFITLYIKQGNLNNISNLYCF